MQTSEKVISTFFFFLFAFLSIIDIFELEIFYIYCANIYVTVGLYIIYNVKFEIYL